MGFDFTFHHHHRWVGRRGALQFAHAHFAFGVDHKGKGHTRCIIEIGKFMLLLGVNDAYGEELDQGFTNWWSAEPWPKHFLIDLQCNTFGRHRIETSSYMGFDILTALLFCQTHNTTVALQWNV